MYVSSLSNIATAGEGRGLETGPHQSGKDKYEMKTKGLAETLRVCKAPPSCFLVYCLPEA